MLERIVVQDYIYPTLSSTTSTLSFSDQFAFRPTGSTASALISLLHSVSAMLTTQPYVRVIALDFSKAFDTVRHSSLLSKLSSLPIPDNIYNWIVNFLSDRSQCTKFEGDQSAFGAVTASVVQGSAIGPALYAVTASDLRPVTQGNEMCKFADDTYLLVPANLSYTCTTELAHIDQWSSANNLSLNRTKSYELIFYRRPPSTVPSLTPGIERVSQLKCLGVTLSSNFSVSAHVSDVITSTTQSLYALRTLRAHGLKDTLLMSVFKATVLAKLTYCSPAWWGFASAEDKNRLEAVLRKATRAKFYSSDGKTIAALCSAADSKLFRNVLLNPDHVLHRLLPPRKSHNYNLRTRTHDLTVPHKMHSLDELNFITRMLYQDLY
jgi:hypothetical protein